MEQDSGQRLLTAALGLAALWAVISRFFIDLGEDGATPLSALWAMAYYFTVWTNAGVGLSMTVSALRGRSFPASFDAGLTVAIVIVGVVYHLLLASLVDFTGLSWWVNQVFHTAVPILAVIHWWVVAPKSGLRYVRIVTWLVYPLVYVIYALIRGGLTGGYPYPFLDVAEQGWGGTLVAIAGIAVGFAALGALLVAIAQRRGGADQSSPGSSSR